jgi:glycosyltransferase involved in cell wall biosynthesis
VASSWRVSVVVPCRNEAAHIATLLDAVGQQTRPPDEVVIADTSSDNSVAVIEAYAKAHPTLGIRVVRGATSSIPAQVNAGIAAATCDLIVRLDGHSAPSVDYIARAVATLEADGDVGVVGGVWHVRPGAASPVAEAIACAVSHPAGAGDASYRIAKNTDLPRDVDTVPFGCFRKALWTALGGYNEALLSNEDYEFNYRVRASGRRVVLDPAMQSVYFARPTFAALATQYFRYGWWKVAMLRRYPESIRLRQGIPAAFVAALLVLLAASLIWPLALFALLALLFIYGDVLALAAIDAPRRTGLPGRMPLLMAVFATIHLCWGGGAVVNAITGGRWPFNDRGGLNISRRAGRE